MNASGLDIFERSEDPSSPSGRPWLGVRFSCRGAYLRVYRSADGTRYHAKCPHCAKSVTFRVGQGGTSERFFVVDCGA